MRAACGSTKRSRPSVIAWPMSCAKYPATAARLAELLGRIVANDQAAEQINAHGLPRNHARLLCAELAARGLDAWVKNWVQTPRITEETVLPSFRQGSDGYLWPAGASARIGPRSSSASVSVGAGCFPALVRAA